ncbi:major facilitator superfamily domain-containing protein [Aspergillus pseudoustus]|uniref:Major facilitator superfamily domain-containing protein n=1 Tax=Aspergillus pseudoustus TaxID=1810923 RepID=A0ABR4I9B2_9EURO
MAAMDEIRVEQNAAATKAPTVRADPKDCKPEHVNTLGSIQLRHPVTNEIILIPTPSNDPNDPLNWSRGYRIYLAVISCASIFLAQLLAAGPSVDMTRIIQDIFGIMPTDPEFSSALSKISYCFTGCAFVQGMSNLVYMPLIIKYGRRPVYILSFIVYGACSLWAGLAKDYPSELAARLVLGFAGGSAECLAPLTIADTFFLHERGLIMSYYSAALSSGVGGGIVLSGLITINNSWRVIYYMATGLIWGLVILITFTMPETAYKRTQSFDDQNHSVTDDDGTDTDKALAAHLEPRIPTKRTYRQQMRLFNPPLTDESLLTLFWRPIPLLFLPSVLWGTLSMSVVIGTFVAISSNYATAFSNTYGFSTLQCGATYSGVLVGALVGIYGGGWLSDKVADLLTIRRGGIREPEMRLPTVTLSLVLSPLGLLLYGAGIAKAMHWIVPVVGLGCVGFVITQVSNIAIVYAVDAHRPIAGEVVVSELSFKAAFGFLLSFYTNPWIESAGYINAFGALAGISAAILVLWIPLYIWGKKIRVWSLGLRVLKGVHWGADREVGE